MRKTVYIVEEWSDKKDDYFRLTGFIVPEGFKDFEFVRFMDKKHKTWKRLGMKKRLDMMAVELRKQGCEEINFV